jgi:cysteine desulfurase
LNSSDVSSGLFVSQDTIYLDHNATTPLLPEVVDAMLPYLRDHFGNPSSSHAIGRVSRAAVDHAREQVAGLLDCGADEVLFTSGGTESNNLAIRGVTEALRQRPHLVTSLVEHPSVAGPCAWLEEHGWLVTRCGVDPQGRVQVEDVIRAAGTLTALVTVMHSQNETGVLQPVAAIAEAVHSVGAFLHTDAAQSVGKVPVSVRTMRVDLLSLAGHKIYAPKGVGALFVRRETPLVPVLLGAGHEQGMRPGTENVPSIVGLGVACERARVDLDAEGTRLRGVRDHLWRRLQERVPELEQNGHPEERLPNTLSVRFPGVSGNALLAACPEIAASTGSACHAGTDEAPRAIVLMGVPAREAEGTVRLTLGRRTTTREIDRAAELLATAWQSLTSIQVNR